MGQMLPSGGYAAKHGRCAYAVKRDIRSKKQIKDTVNFDVDGGTRCCDSHVRRSFWFFR